MTTTVREQNSLELTAPDQKSIQVQQPEFDLLRFIAEAARDSSVDVGKMQLLLQMKRELDEEKARQLFNQAMIAAQEDMRPVLRNCKNADSGSAYANLEAIDKAVRPVYTRHGFVLSFNSEPGTEKSIVMRCTCMHKGGYSADYRLEGGLDDSGIKGTRNKTAVMAAGSTVSYLRRYLTCMIFNIVLTNEDDDGVGARAPITKEQVGQLLDLLNDGGIPESAFTKSANIKRVEDLPAQRFQAAVIAIRARIAAKAGK